MGRMSLSARARVVIMWKQRFALQKIQAILREEGTEVSKTSLSLLIKKFTRTGSVEDHRTVQRPQKLSHEMVQFLDSAMASNNELSAKEATRSAQVQIP